NGEEREWKANPARVEAPLGMAPLVSGEPVELGDLASFSRGDQVTYGGFIRVEAKPTSAVIARMDPGQAFRGWDLYLQGGKPAAHVIDSWDKAADKIIAPDELQLGKWHHVMVTFDGTQAGHQALAIHVDGVRQNAGPYPNTVGGHIETPVPLRLGSRQGGDSKLNGPVALQDFRFYRRLLSQQEIEALANSSTLRHVLAIPPSDRTPEQTDALHRYYLANVD